MTSAHYPPRQTEVLRLAAQGYTNQQIALKMGIKRKTVEHHVTALKLRWRIWSKTELAHFALAKGLIENIFDGDGNRRPEK